MLKRIKHFAICGLTCNLPKAAVSCGAGYYVVVNY